MTNLHKLRQLIDYLEENDVEVIKEQEAIYRAIFKASLDSIIVINQEGKIVDMNDSAEDLFNYSKEEVEGQDVSMFIADPKHKKNHSSYIKDYVSTGNPSIIGLERTLEAVDKSGKKFPIVLGVSEVILPDKKLFVGVIRNLNGWRDRVKGDIKDGR